MKILCLNCQKAYHPDIKNFLETVLKSQLYDFLLLQEADVKILDMLHPPRGYKLLLATNPDNQLQSHLCLTYRENISLVASEFVSFAKTKRSTDFRAEQGFLIGVFEFKNQPIIMGSTHLHSGLPLQIRRKELKLIKNKLAAVNPRGCPAIFGGDFNLGYPGELQYARKLLSPQFKDATRLLGPTLNSQYTEKAPHFASRASRILGKLGLKILLKADRIFIDNHTLQTHNSHSRILPDRVSDHSPIELIIDL